MKPPRSSASAFRQGAEAERRAAIRLAAKHCFERPGGDCFCRTFIKALKQAPLPSPRTGRTVRKMLAADFNLKALVVPVPFLGPTKRNRRA